MAGLAKISRGRAQVDKAIGERRYYDAICIIKALTRRLPDEHRRVVFTDYAQEFLRYEQYELVSDLGSHIVTLPYSETLARAAVEVTMLITSPLNEAGALCPPSDLLDKYFRDLRRWGERRAKENDGIEETYLLDTYPLIAEYYWKNKAYREAQQYFLLNIPQCVLRYADLIIDWSDLGYASERDLFLLRGALIILGYRENARNVAEAERYLNYVASQQGCNWMITEHLTCPCAQVAHFIVLALKLENLAFFDKVVGKYTLVLQRDPAMHAVIQSIRQKHFNPGQTDFLSLFGLR